MRLSVHIYTSVTNFISDDNDAQIVSMNCFVVTKKSFQTMKAEKMLYNGVAIYFSNTIINCIKRAQRRNKKRNQKCYSER